ncbi:MAG: NAD(P)(+) transhydrogenase (Re/Si-specific) subunit beta, partial [Neisseriaceae bacterium]|nr:NAD(P)(+) transhydrogenase (Re/Si-specific) subunit beta [Neisseriaceae bacterium]
MATGIVTSAYIIAAIFFILALAGLSKQETAKNGNMFGMIGMAIALIATILSEDVNGLIWIIIAMLGGAIVGIYKAKKVEMTQMPELIALLHSFVGLTAVLVGFNSFIQSDKVSPDMETVHLIEVFLGVFIGAVTFTGSIVAWGKLKGKISGKPMMLPHKHMLNLGALILSLILLIAFVAAEGSWVCLILMTIIALAFGWHLVASIGGADMPVVVSMLNSYSGWAAAAAGFM